MANTKKYVSLDKLGLYDEKIKAKIAADDATTLASAKAYADGLASNYDAAGAAATVQENLDAEITRAKAAEEANATAAKKAQDEVDALEEVVATKAAQSDLDALETLVGTLPEGTTAKDVVDYVNVKTAGIATDAALGELQSQLSGVQSEVATIKGDYLKGQDKTDLTDAINTEKERAMEVEGDLETRLAAVEGDYLKGDDKEELAGLIGDNATAIDNIEKDYLKAADKEELTTAINTEKERAMGVEGGLEDRIETMEAFWAAAEADGTDKDVIDTLKEIQEYIAGDETGASEMAASIKQNSDDIDALEGRMDDAETALETVDTRIAAAITNANLDQYATDTEMTAAVERIAALETADGVQDGLIEGLRTDVDTKATQSDLDTVAGKVTTVEGKVATLEAQLGDGEGSVADMVADAKQEAIDAAATDATTKANTAETNAKTYADDLNTAMDTRVGVIEAASATHATKTEVEAVAERVTTLEGDMTQAKTDIDAVEVLAAANDAAIKALQSAMDLKASQEDLSALDTRVVTLETWHNNFTEVSEEEINNLFA